MISKQVHGHLFAPDISYMCVCIVAVCSDSDYVPERGTIFDTNCSSRRLRDLKYLILMSCVSEGRLLLLVLNMLISRPIQRVRLHNQVHFLLGTSMHLSLLHHAILTPQERCVSGYQNLWQKIGNVVTPHLLSKVWQKVLTSELKRFWYLCAVSQLAGASYWTLKLESNFLSPHQLGERATSGSLLQELLVLRLGTPESTRC